MRGIRENLPDAVVIDLSRLPSHGREIAVWLRSTKRTRHVPIVFANGDGAKVAAIRELLPDAAFTATSDIAPVLKSAGVRPVSNPVVPAPMMERYGARSTAQKLGICPASTVGVIDAPRDYPAVIGEVPEGVEITEDPPSVQQVTLWFVHEMDGMRQSLRRMRAIAGKTKLWVVWPKGSKNGIGDNAVREAAIGAGLVDYKICALGGHWSGMLFALRKT
jgi:Protein of unknown function (DUF3052)